MRAGARGGIGCTGLRIDIRFSGKDSSNESCCKGIPSPDRINDIYGQGCQPAPALFRCDKTPPCPAGYQNRSDVEVVTYFIDVRMRVVIVWCTDVLRRGDTEEATDDWQLIIVELENICVVASLFENVR